MSNYNFRLSKSSSKDPRAYPSAYPSDPRDLRDPRDYRDPRGYADVRDPRDPRNVRDFGETREVRNPPTRYGESSSLDLKAYLDTHKGSKSLRLADMSFGDEGADLLRDFLEKNRQVETLELRGNNITSEGFFNISQGLSGNILIKTLSLEWNNLGSGTRGIEALADFATQNNSLEYLDLRNNKLNTSAAPALAKIIKASHSLVTLDLRWNELGNHGARTILEALEGSHKIINIELGGNNVTEDLISQIHGKLDNNRQKRPELGSNRSAVVNSGGSNIRTTKFEVPRENREMLEDLQRALTANAELERVLHVEARKNSDLKEKFYRDMDLASRELQNKIDHLLRENASLQSTIKSLEADGARMTKENGVLKDKIANLDSMHLQDLQTIEGCQQTIRTLETDLRNSEANYKTNLDRLVNGHAVKSSELENTWDLRLKEVMRENDFLIERNKDIERELERLIEENRTLVFTTDDRVRDSSLRAREEERQKNSIVINDLEIKLRLSEEELYRLKREFEDSESEFSRRRDYSEDKLRQANEEIRRLKSEVTINVEYYNKEKLKVESLQNEIMVRDNTILKLESDLREIQKVLHNKELMYQEQIDISKREHEEDGNRWEDTKTTLQRRIADLEKQNRQIQSELNRLRTDMQRLSELLVTNLSQTVYKTFSELK